MSKVGSGAMHYTFDYSRKQIAAACLLSGFIAAGISALTDPSAANNAPASSISINRAAKRDQLRPAPSPQQPTDNSGAIDTVRPPKFTPLSCEPAFSRIADPARADIVKRCLA
jgi:hypothetical protein